MLARKTAVFKPCNGQHQRSENPNATPGHSQIFRKITVMVPSGQKWHRNREKTDIYILLLLLLLLLSVQVVLLQQHIKSLSSRLWLFLEVNRSLYACIGCLLYTPEGIIKWHFTHLLSPLSSSVAHHFLSILFSGSLNETL